MGTQKIRPEIGAEHQREKELRASRTRRVVALAVVAAVLFAVIVFAATRPHTKAATPLPSSVPSSTPAHPVDPLVPEIVGLGGVFGPGVLSVSGVPSDAVSLDLSADGRRIVFVTWDTKNMKGICGACSSRARIAIIGTDGTNAHFLELPGSTGAVTMPAWSPDGSRLAFVMENHIYMMDANGSHMRRLTDGLEDEFPVWSPDGTMIAYDSSGNQPFDDSGLSPTQEIWTVPSDGGTSTRLTHNRVPDQAPTFSPDGARIAFFHDGSIAVIGASGGGIRPLRGNPEGWTPRWSPDGTKIAFLDFRGDRAEVPSLKNPAVPESLPLGSVEILDLASGGVSDTGVATPSSYSAVSWTPQSDGLLVNAYLPATASAP